MSNKPSDILSSEIRQGTIRPGDKEYAVWDTTGGLTDDLREASIYNQLGNTHRMRDAEVSAATAVPTLEAALKALGINDTKDKKAYRRFVEDFPSKQKEWKAKIERDPRWGTRGWETIKDLFRKTNNDIAVEDTKQARYDAMHDGSIWDKIANLIFPRAVKAGEEGRDPTAGEWVRDGLANAAYAVPFGNFVKAGKILSPAISNAIAPVAVAAMDNIADDSRDSGDFATDALVGTLTNLGVNRALAPALGRAIGTMGGAIEQRLPPSVKNILQGTTSPAKEEAKSLVAQAGKAVKAPKTASEAAQDILSGSKPVLSKDRATASDILDIADAAKQKYGSRSAESYFGESAKDVSNDFADDVLGEMVALKKTPIPAEMTDEAVGQYTKDYLNNLHRYSAVLSANPSLRTLFKDDPKFLSAYPFKAPELNRKQKAYELLKGVGEGAQTYAVNQWGSSKNAPAVMAGSSVGLDVKGDIEKHANDKRKKTASASVSRVLGAPDLTEEDRKYLKMVQDDPDVLTYGTDDGLKMWLLKRGHGLLQGTAAHRPLWEVK